MLKILTGCVLILSLVSLVDNASLRANFRFGRPKQSVTRSKCLGETAEDKIRIEREKNETYKKAEQEIKKVFLKQNEKSLRDVLSIVRNYINNVGTRLKCEEQNKKESEETEVKCREESEQTSKQKKSCAEKLKAITKILEKIKEKRRQEMDKKKKKTPIKQYPMEEEAEASSVHEIIQPPPIPNPPKVQGSSHPTSTPIRPRPYPFVPPPIDPTNEDSSVFVSGEDSVVAVATPQKPFSVEYVSYPGSSKSPAAIAVAVDEPAPPGNPQEPNSPQIFYSHRPIFVPPLQSPEPRPDSRPKAVGGSSSAPTIIPSSPQEPVPTAPLVVPFSSPSEPPKHPYADYHGTLPAIAVSSSEELTPTPQISTPINSPVSKHPYAEFYGKLPVLPVSTPEEPIPLEAPIFGPVNIPDAPEEPFPPETPKLPYSDYHGSLPEIPVSSPEKPQEPTPPEPVVSVAVGSPEEPFPIEPPNLDPFSIPESKYPYAGFYGMVPMVPVSTPEEPIPPEAIFSPEAPEAPFPPETPKHPYSDYHGRLPEIFVNGPEEPEEQAPPESLVSVLVSNPEEPFAPEPPTDPYADKINPDIVVNKPEEPSPPELPIPGPVSSPEEPFGPEPPTDPHAEDLINPDVVATNLGEPSLPMPDPVSSPEEPFAPELQNHQPNGNVHEVNPEVFVSDAEETPPTLPVPDSLISPEELFPPESLIDPYADSQAPLAPPNRPEVPSVLQELPIFSPEEVLPPEPLKHPYADVQDTNIPLASINHPEEPLKHFDQDVSDSLLPEGDSQFLPEENLQEPDDLKPSAEAVVGEDKNDQKIVLLPPLVYIHHPYKPLPPIESLEPTKFDLLPPVSEALIEIPNNASDQPPPLSLKDHIKKKIEKANDKKPEVTCCQLEQQISNQTSIVSRCKELITSLIQQILQGLKSTRYRRETKYDQQDDGGINTTIETQKLIEEKPQSNFTSFKNGSSGFERLIEFLRSQNKQLLLENSNTAVNIRDININFGLGSISGKESNKTLDELKTTKEIMKRKEEINKPTQNNIVFNTIEDPIKEIKKNNDEFHNYVENKTERIVYHEDGRKKSDKIEIKPQMEEKKQEEGKIEAITPSPIFNETVNVSSVDNVKESSPTKIEEKKPVESKKTEETKQVTAKEKPQNKTKQKKKTLKKKSKNEKSKKKKKQKKESSEEDDYDEDYSEELAGFLLSFGSKLKKSISSMSRSNNDEDMDFESLRSKKVFEILERLNDRDFFVTKMDDYEEDDDVMDYLY